MAHRVRHEKHQPGGVKLPGNIIVNFTKQPDGSGVSQALDEQTALAAAAIPGYQYLETTEAEEEWYRLLESGENAPPSVEDASAYLSEKVDHAVQGFVITLASACGIKLDADESTATLREKIVKACVGGEVERSTPITDEERNEIAVETLTSVIESAGLDVPDGQTLESLTELIEKAVEKGVTLEEEVESAVTAAYTDLCKEAGIGLDEGADVDEARGAILSAIKADQSTDEADPVAELVARRPGRPRKEKAGPSPETDEE